MGHHGDACLPWPFSKDGRVGRGGLTYRGKSYWAHRLMCELAHGAPPTPKHQAAHNCGKGHYGCVNPKHLEWKTNSQNQIDRAKNGNALRNSHGPRGGLTSEQKAEIISLKGKMTQTAIATKFGVSLGCVQYWIKYRKVRGHDRREKYAWMPDEEAKLRKAVAAGMAPSAISVEFNRTVGSIVSKMDRLGLSHPNRH